MARLSTKAAFFSNSHERGRFWVDCGMISHPSYLSHCAAPRWAPAPQAGRPTARAYRRELTLTARYNFLYIFRVCQVAVMASITGTMFMRTRQAPTSLLNGQNFISVSFFSVMFLFFNGQTELTIAVSHLHMSPQTPQLKIHCKFQAGHIQIMCPRETELTAVQSWHADILAAYRFPWALYQYAAWHTQMQTPVMVALCR